MYNV
jgi:outer membrane murein-binding lipoprotein Lpp